MTSTHPPTYAAKPHPLLSLGAIAVAYVPDRGPPSTPPHRRPNTSLRDAVKIEAIHIGHVEDHASPPGPLSVRRLRDQVQIARSSAEAGERGCFTPEQGLKPERLVEPDS